MSTPANALNISTAGLVKFDGTSAFSTTTVTQHDTLVGGASNAITSIAPGTSGQVLTSNGAGADPAYKSISAAGGVIQINGDTGSATPAAGIITFQATPGVDAGSSVSFQASTSVVALKTTDANGNTIIGQTAGNATISGTSSVGLGIGVLQAVTSGGSLTAIGGTCLESCTSGADNTGIGNSSLFALKTGNFNIGIGSGFPIAGQSYTGAESSNIVIGNIGVLGESNVIRIGTQGSLGGQQNQCFIAGITGVTTTNTNFVTVNTSTGQLGASATATSMIWSAIGASQTLAVANGYFCTSGGALSLALPATSAVGDTIDVVLDGSTSWTITQPNAGTRIRLGSSQTTLGVGGTLASTAQGDSIRLVCETANARWVVVSSMGNITVA